MRLPLRMITKLTSEYHLESSFAAMNLFDPHCILGPEEPASSEPLRKVVLETCRQ